MRRQRSFLSLLAVEELSNSRLAVGGLPGTGVGLDAEGDRVG